MDADPTGASIPIPSDKSERIYKSRRKLIFDNFLGGIAWSLGTFVGFGAVAVLIGYIVSQINLVPIIGSWIGDIMKEAVNKIQPPGNFD